MDSSAAIPPVYKPWLHHANVSSSSLVASGMEIGVPPGTTPPRSPSQNSNKSLPCIPTDQTSARGSFEGPKAVKKEGLPESSLYLRNFPLERVKDLPTTPPLRFSPNTSRRSTPSTGSSRKIRQLTGVDLHIGNEVELSDNGDDEDSAQDPDSPTSSASPSSMYSQAGIDYKAGNTGYMAQRSLAPRDSGIVLQSSIYQTPRQLYEDEKLMRALRHKEQPSEPQKANSVRLIRPENPTKVNVLQDITFQQQQRKDLGAACNHDVYSTVAHSPVSELEDTAINAASLIPRPLTIRTKKNTSLLPPKYSIFQNATDSWNYGLNELVSPSANQFAAIEYYRSHRSNSPILTPVSPMGSMESDHIILPPLPDTPPPPASRRFGSGKHPFKSPFPASSRDIKAYEDLDTIASPVDAMVDSISTPTPTSTRRVSGRLLGGWSGGRPKSPIRNKARRSGGPDTPVVSKVGGFAGFNMLQKGNEHLQEVVRRARERVLKKDKSADERRRESLKGKIVVVGVPDQSPDGRVSEWL